MSSKKSKKSSIKDEEDKKLIEADVVVGPRTEPLKKWEISYCQREYVKMMHPIKDRTYLKHICPTLKKCCKRDQMSFEKAL